MKFDLLDQKLRVFETEKDQLINPKSKIVARLDGRGFTRLTKETHDFEAPFDQRFAEIMSETTQHLMGCGFKMIYGFCQSDEISLLIDSTEMPFQGKSRKLISVLAGEASAKFSLLLGGMGVFDCRISELPKNLDVIDYFRWRSEDAKRNSLNAHCYWNFRKKGMSGKEAANQIENIAVESKKLILKDFGVDYSKLPKWQTCGVGHYWEEIEKEGFNPITKKTVMAKRKVLTKNSELPEGQDYSNLLAQLVGGK